MAAASAFSLLTTAGEPATPAGPACEASIVRIGYIWLLVLLPTAGLAIGLVSLATQPSALVLALAAGLLAAGYWAFGRGYQAVRLELEPAVIHIQPKNPAQPAQEVPLARIANYLRPEETYYRVLELQLHGGSVLRLSKRLGQPAGLLSLDAWAGVLAARLEQTRPAAAPSSAGAALGTGLLAEPPRVFARTGLGRVLAGLAGVWLVLAGLALLGNAHVSAALFVAPSLYLGYYFRARGTLKVQTKVLTGIEADRDNWRAND